MVVVEPVRRFRSGHRTSSFRLGTGHAGGPDTARCRGPEFQHHLPAAAGLPLPELVAERDSGDRGCVTVDHLPSDVLRSGVRVTRAPVAGPGVPDGIDSSRARWSLAAVMPGGHGVPFSTCPRWGPPGPRARSPPPPAGPGTTRHRVIPVTTGKLSSTLGDVYIGRGSFPSSAPHPDAGRGVAAGVVCGARHLGSCALFRRRGRAGPPCSPAGASSPGRRPVAVRPCADTRPENTPGNKAPSGTRKRSGRVPRRQRRQPWANAVLFAYFRSL